MLFKSLVVLGGAALAAAKVQFMGMNIAGFEFGCLIDGTCPTGSVVPPDEGAAQMQHFVKDDQLNIFRLPVSWQFLVNNQLGGTLDSNNFGEYDKLMQDCLATGSYCAIDIHNFARWNGKIIGQAGGPTDDQFADLWKQLATKYNSNTKVIFGLMNEPHNVDMTAWAASCQAAVTAIRNAGATSQMILLPGNNFTSAATFVSGGSGDALLTVKNPDGTTTGLLMDIHKYLDFDNSGNHQDCTTDNKEAFASVAQFLRENGRQAMVSETGAGSTDSCQTAFCAQNAFINQNSDVFMGIIAWAAGSFATSYTLSLTPKKQNGKFVNDKLAAECVVAVWVNAPAVTTPAPIIPVAPVVAPVPAPNTAPPLGPTLAPPAIATPIAAPVNSPASNPPPAVVKPSGTPPVKPGNGSPIVATPPSEEPTLMPVSRIQPTVHPSFTSSVAPLSTGSLSSPPTSNASSPTSGNSTPSATQNSNGLLSSVFSSSLFIGMSGFLGVLLV
ncbi:hypothetical protein HYALB_00011991 [Hymenoscyphus albidus]|uniref:Endoglucanase EG-II n=1 Tax=Hymenoscyphus albidus TaxID=595503 RepID=A0A9N9LS46_9HELO|nr:hypothetical protein HYALB_00011991 [Hymenoscyphus albidus]